MPEGVGGKASARQFSRWMAGVRAALALPGRRARREKELDPATLPPARAGVFDIVCLPIIEWDFRFQRPQQLMRRLARAGHRVFYVSGSFRSRGASVLIGSREERLFTVSLRGLARNVYRDEMDERARAALAGSIADLAAGADLRDVVCFAQLPFWEPLASHFRRSLGWTMIYDCMDDHAGFSTNTAVMLAAEDRLFRTADLVLASSVRLESRARARNPRVLLLRNGADVAHFGGLSRRNPGGRPVVGYYGAVADWLDTGLIGALARRRPEWDFVLVGSTYSADLTPLEGLSNVSLPGEIPYAEIPNWLARFDVCVIPFRRTALTEATNPVKIYEMLAAGKPVVSVPIPEVAAMAPLVRLASTAGEFDVEIEASLAEPPDLHRERRKFAAENSWERRVDALLAGIAAIRPSTVPR